MCSNARHSPRPHVRVRRVAPQVATSDTLVRRDVCVADAYRRRYSIASRAKAVLRRSLPYRATTGTIHAHSLHKAAHCLPRACFIFSHVALLYATPVDLRDRAVARSSPPAIKLRFTQPQPRLLIARPDRAAPHACKPRVRSDASWSHPTRAAPFFW